MKPTKVEFSFDDAKLEAISLFLKEKGGNLDEELDHFMDALYKKYVPQQVREFIEKKEAEAAQTAQSTKKFRSRKPAAVSEAVCGVSSDGTATQPTGESPA